MALSPAEAHIQRTIDLLQQERDTDLAQTSLLSSKCSPKLLEARGLAILNLQVTNISVGLGGKTIVELERWMKGPLPSHSFRNGDICEILGNDAGVNQPTSSKGKGKANDKSQDSPEAAKFQATVYRVHEEKLVVAMDSKDKDDQDPILPEKCRCQKLANTVTYDRMDKTLHRLLKLVSPSTVAPPTLIQILFGLQQPSNTAITAAQRDSIVFLDTNLNDSQKDAVQFAVYESDQVALIHGPPGTGKTSTLIECIRHFVNLDKRVLVCAASNLAVDNILERLSLHLPSQAMSRIGHPARILPQLMKSTLDYQTTYSNSGQVTRELKDEIEQITKTLTSGKVRGKERRDGWSEVRELRKEYRKREGDVVKGIVSQSKVVLATCHGAGSRQIADMDFDILIIDEAAQALEAVCWIPILKTKQKLILAGDHLQLPPTIKTTVSPSKGTDKSASTKASDTNGKIVDKAVGGAGTKNLSPKSLEVTLFDRLLTMYGSKIKRLLNVQYRMHEKIMQFPSTELYANKLVAHESVAQRLLRDLPGRTPSSNGTGSSDDEDDGLLTEPVIFYDTAGLNMYERAEDKDTDPSVRRTLDGESKSNENEAEIVMKFIEELLQAGVPQSSIAVITPYNAQVALITALLRAKYPPDTVSSTTSTDTSAPAAIECGSVDGFQGREKDVIILSLVRSNDKKEVGFLSEKRRLNVAITRPKRCLCIVGDSETVGSGNGSANKFLRDWMAWLEENADIRVVQ